MSKKVKIDPITRTKQAIQFFENLKAACEHLTKLVEFNISDAKKSLDRLEKQEEAMFEKTENPAQTKQF